MADDRITDDMRAMARSYDAPRPVSLMQDKFNEVRGTVSSAKQTAREVARQTSDQIGNAVQGVTQTARAVKEGFKQYTETNARKHEALAETNRKQVAALTSLNRTVDNIHRMVFKDAHGPDVEAYARDKSAKELAALLTRNHKETIEELEKIRKAILQGGGGGGFGGFFGGRGMRGGRRGGGGGGRRGRRGGGGGPQSQRARTQRSSSPSPQSQRARTQRPGGPQSRAHRTSSAPSTTSSSSSWGRSTTPSASSSASTGGMRGGGGNWRVRLLQGVISGGTAIAAGSQMMGRRDTEIPTPSSSSSSSSTPYRGLGSISASNESTKGVHEISSGRGDHGGVSYGTHQLASANGSMSAFLQSEEGAPFAPMFGNLQPGTELFNRAYEVVARDHEDAFSAAQSAYIARTHYEPMQENVMRGSGFDASERGPAVQEMLYSTGVQYGTGTSVINKALANHNPNSMSDEDIIRVVQQYKADTTDSYFRSSSAQVRDSVRNRAIREMGQLLALNEQYLAGELGEEWGQPEGEGAGGPAQVASTAPAAPAAPQAEGDPDAGGISTATMVGAAGATAAAGGVAVAARSQPAASVTTSQSAIPATPTTPQTGAQAAPSAPAGNAPAAQAQSAANKGSTLSKVKAGARRVPVLSTGMAVVDVAGIVTDDELTGAEKAGAVTDVAGGTVGGIAGAKAGAAVGGAAGLAFGPAAPLAVPVLGAVGGLVGGVGGYMAGSSATQKVRGWFGKDEEEPVDLLPQEDALMGQMIADATSENRAEAESETPEIAQSALVAATEVATNTASEPSTVATAVVTTTPSEDSPEQPATEAAEQVASTTPTTPTPVEPASSFEEDEGSSVAEQALFGTAFRAMFGTEVPELSSTRPGVPDSMKHLFTERDGNSVRHDFTQHMTPNGPAVGPRRDIANEPIVVPQQNITAPAPGTAPAFLGQSSPVISQSMAVQQTASNFQSSAVNDTPARRQQYDSVQKVMMMEPAAPKAERQDLTEPPRSASSSTFESRHHQPTIDDTPALVTDFGLTLLNTGFI